MRRPLLSFLLLAFLPSSAFAQFELRFSDADFGVTSVFNDVAAFSFDIVVNDNLQAGRTYVNPDLVSVSYVVNGVLAQPTPSGFPGFFLQRTISGSEFYSLSPDATLVFEVAASANLADGLQLSELVGAPTFLLNAREFNQDPGRFHPPIFSLESNGTGRLTNANNQSTFNNPATGAPVDIEIADEYDVNLSFTPSLVTISDPVIAVPLPLPAVLLLSLGLAWFGRSRLRARES